MSPNYPLAYGRSAECFWALHGSRGSFLHLQFLDFELEQHNECNYDYVEVSMEFFQASMLHQALLEHR